MFSKVGFLFYFVLFLQEGATKSELVAEESDTDIFDRAPQEQTNHDRLTSVDRAHKNDRRGKSVNFFEFFLCLKANIKPSKEYASKYYMNFFLSKFLLLSFFITVPPTTNLFFLRMLQLSEILFHYFILLKYSWIEIGLYMSLKFIVSKCSH